jgi:t-SNARE complex subunit (syntaxin)
MDKLSQLKEKRATAKETETPSKKRGKKEDKSPKQEEGDYIGQFDAVKKNLEHIKANTDQVLELKKRVQMMVKDSDEKEISSDLEDLMSDTKAVALKAKKTLDALETETAKLKRSDPTSSTVQIRVNMASSSSLKFQEVMRAYQTACESVKMALTKRVERQIRIGMHSFGVLWY